MRGAIAALLAISMLFLGFSVGLSVNPLQSVSTKVVTSTVTITAPPSIITASAKEPQAHSVTQTITAYVSKTITEILERTSSITESMKKTVTTFLTEKTAQTVTVTTTSQVTLSRTVTTTRTATITSYTTSIDTTTLTETTTTYLTSTETTTATKTTTTTSTIHTTKTVTTTETAESVQIEGAEVDLVAAIYRVVGGDTFDAFPSGRVRLADINAPELDEAGGQEAKDALTNLVLNKKVYLDVDDLYVMDKYNRLICVVFIDYNSTHVLNVNKWLIEKRLRADHRLFKRIQS